MIRIPWLNKVVIIIIIIIITTIIIIIIIIITIIVVIIIIIIIIIIIFIIIIITVIIIIIFIIIIITVIIIIIIILRCSPELQYDVCRNVVLSGGTTLTRGLVPRLEHELSKINPNIRSVRAPDNRAYSAWIGGSILGSLSTLDSMYATIDEYADCGGRIISQKCF